MHAVGAALECEVLSLFATSKGSSGQQDDHALGVAAAEKDETCASNAGAAQPKYAVKH